MKTKIKFFLVLLIAAMSFTNVNAQSGSSCESAISIVTNSSQTFYFSGSVIWFKFTPDIIPNRFEFLRESSAATNTNIGEIDIYEGDNCSDLTPYFSRTYNDSDSI